MSVFTVDLTNQPGELARLCEGMADRGINLVLCATTRGLLQNRMVAKMISTEHPGRPSSSQVLPTFRARKGPRLPIPPTKGQEPGIPQQPARGQDGTVVFIADDEASAETVLQDADIGYTMRPALTIRMENQPGAGAATFRKLADAGVNADLLLPVRVSDELFFAVICVDDQDKARHALGAQVVPGSVSP